MRNILLCPALLIFISVLTLPVRSSSSLEQIPTLQITGNSLIKQIHKDIRKGLSVVKGKRPVTDLPELRFYIYRVKKGDSFWTISSRLSMDIDTLVSVNDLSSPRDIKPGVKLYVPNMRGILVSTENKDKIKTICKNEKIGWEYILAANKVDKTFTGKKYLFIPCGKMTRLQRSLFLGTGFMYPVQTGRQTSGFGTRKSPFNRSIYEFHTGIDIACNMETHIHASRGGTVRFTGYSGGYGKLIIIEHEHGYCTYYGHLSRVHVKNGQKISQGQTIALSGNTGRSTGPHLHFEIRKGEKALNPMNLLHHP